MKPTIKYAAVLAVALAFSCKSIDEDVKFTFTVPSENVAQFDVELLKNLGLGLSGEYQINEWAKVYFVPQAMNQNFHFGFVLNTMAFDRNNWPEFDEVDKLPTGAMFPTWVTQKVVDVQVPQFDTKNVGWHFYFGGRGQLVVASAAQFPAIGKGWPNLSIGYDFYDKAGKLILGVLFFGPSFDAAGNVVEPGGIFLGTDLTPRIGGTPPGENPTVGTMTLAIQSAKARSAYSEVKVMGKDKKKYKSASKVQALIDRYMEVTQH